MKKLFLTVLIFMFFVGISNAADLKWDVATGEVGGYYVYYGTQTGLYPNRLDVGNVTSVIEIVDVFRLLSDTEYFFVVSAYNAAGESDISNEANYTTPVVLTIPGKVTITITAIE